MTRRYLAPLIIVLAYSLSILAPVTVQALSQDQIDALNSGVYYFNTEDPNSGMGTCGVSDVSGGGPTGGGSQPLNPSQIQIAKIIMGVAKTDNLGQQGALIGLMVALDESHLRILANSNVPVSESNPAKQGDGSNADSVGVFQQRPSTSWSTLAPSGGAAADSNKAAVWQLMDPAYSAEAFFGSPIGSNAPGPLSKGLQNKPGWQSMQPWVAAQAVQASGTKDGSNYRPFVSAAQSLINSYWDAAAPVPLPVALNGSGNVNTEQPATCTSTVAASGDCTVTSPVTGAIKGSGSEYSQAQLAAIFGDPGTAADHSAMQAKQVSVNFLGHSVSVNPLAAGCLSAVATEIRQSNSSYRIISMGCYRFDSDNGSSNIGLSSYHTYGAACDINPDTNPFQICPCNAGHDIPPVYVQAFSDHGFTWGGNWVSRKDYMHFEFNGIMPPR